MAILRAAPRESRAMSKQQCCLKVSFDVSISLGQFSMLAYPYFSVRSPNDSRIDRELTTTLVTQNRFV